jgi:hypothetical protein
MPPSRLIARVRRSPGAVVAVLAGAAVLLLWFVPDAAESLLAAFAAINARVGSLGP